MYRSEHCGTERHTPEGKRTMVPPEAPPRQHDSTTERLWEIGEVAAFLGVTDRAIRNYMALDNDPLPASRIGGVLRFFPDEVRAWARRQGRVA